MNSLKILLVLTSTLLWGSNAQAKEGIVYSRLTDGFWQLWMMGDDGENKKQITFSKEDKRNPFWIKKDGRLGYRTPNGELWTINLKGEEQQEILSQYKPMANPDYAQGTHELVFVRFHPSSVDVGDIWKADLKTQETVVLTKDAYLSFQPRIMDNGEKIVFVKLDDQREHQLWIMNSDGTNAQQLTKGAGRRDLPDITVDGREIVFTSNHEGADFDLFLMDLDTGSVKRLLGQPGMDTSPRFSLDDQRVAFVSNVNNQKEIWVIHKMEEKAMQLTEDAPSIDPVWVEVGDE